MLESSKLVAFVAATDAARAKAFFGDVLGLPLVSEDVFAVVFDAHGTTLRVAIVSEIALAPFTVLGWSEVRPVFAGIKPAALCLKKYVA